MEIKRDLLSMGYRLMKPGVWGKPFGYHLLVFEEDKMLLSNWFIGNGETHLWNTLQCHEDISLLDSIKSFEASTKVDGHSNSQSQFHFLTPEQHLETV